MKKNLVIILLVFSSNCWAQIATVPLFSPVSVDTNKMPQFVGGYTALNDFLVNNIHYPLSAMDKGIEGYVYTSFDVDTDGTLINITIVKDIGGGCGDEAVRVIKLMPKWIPGHLKGKAVKVNYKMPIIFRLN
jgi:periplasmic protein TonB